MSPSLCGWIRAYSFSYCMAGDWGALYKLVGMMLGSFSQCMGCGGLMGGNGCASSGIGVWSVALINFEVLGLMPPLPPSYIFSLSGW